MKTSLNCSGEKWMTRAIGRILLGAAALWIGPGITRAQLYIAQDQLSSPTGGVRVYDPGTASLINSNLITSGLSGPSGLALSGNDLYVSNYYSGQVGKYNASTGAVDAGFATITESGPAVGLAVSGNVLFVSNGGSVDTYNASTGVLIKSGFITGLSWAYGLAISGNSLFVADRTNKAVGEFNASTGVTLKANIMSGFSAPLYLALSGDSLFITDYDNNAVAKYSISARTGTANFISGVASAAGVAVLGNDLFVTSYYGNAVYKFDATTEAQIGGTSFIAGLGAHPAGLAVAAVPEPAAAALLLGLAALGIVAWRRRGSVNPPDGQFSCSTAPK